MRVYYYSWGDEDILGARIEIMKDQNDIYTIRFEQEGFESKLFSNIKIKGNIIDKTDNSVEGEYGIRKRTILIKFRAILNPKPEDLFEIEESSEYEIEESWNDVIEKLLSERYQNETLT